jgi:hypothetical protein
MISGGGTIEPEQRAAARVVGVLYSATMAADRFRDRPRIPKRRPHAVSHRNQTNRQTGRPALSRDIRLRDD